MSAHTPGPWRYWPCRIDSSTGMENYTQFVNHEGHVFRAPLRYLREEDARLIAAAPELLEALKSLIDMDVAYNRGPVVEDAVTKARAAIAKAEGKA